MAARDEEMCKVSGARPNQPHIGGGGGERE